MTQTAIVGNTGGGKSYHAAEVILEELAKNRHVVTNIPIINIESPFLHLDWDWDYLKPTWTGEEYPKGALFVLDECWRGIPSGLKVSDIPVRTMEFFKEQRHMVDEQGRSNDVILVTQDLNDIASAIRGLCKFTTLCVKPSDIGQDGLSIRYIHNGAVKGLEPVKAKLVKTQTVKLKPEVFNFYKSHTKSDSAVLGAAEGTQKITIFSGWKFNLYILACLLCVLIVGFGGYHFMTVIYPKYSGDKEPQPAPAVVPAAAPAAGTALVSAPAKPEPPPPPKESEVWRLVGELKMNGQHWALISNNSRTSRKIDIQNCKRYGGQLECMHKGELVAAWTGQTESDSNHTELLFKGASQTLASADKAPMMPVTKPPDFRP